jgi:Ankyrin repeats (3 copies)
MARKKALKKKARETALVPHRAPNLSALLERAKSGDSALAVKAYLDAGGSVEAVVHGKGPAAILQLPLLHYMVMYNAHPHAELSESVRLLVDAGADISTMAGPDDNSRNALMCASTSDCCNKMLQVFLDHGADMLMPCRGHGRTALHWAAGFGRSDSCELLLAKESSLMHVRATTPVS